MRFTALTSGEIDVLSRNTTETLSRDMQHGEFIGVNYYDGQGLMVRKSLGVKSALELGGASVCTNTAQTTELNVADFFRTNNLEYELVAFELADEVVAAYDAVVAMSIRLTLPVCMPQRTKLNDPSEHVVLPEIISKEPLGPVCPPRRQQVGRSRSLVFECHDCGRRARYYF